MTHWLLIIRPSSSPAGAGFFFVDKKDKTLRPCIDYLGLNDITIKNRYPLPLISSAFEFLQGATIYTKLNLRNHLVQIREGDEWKTAFNTDPAKVSAVLSWPMPDTRKQIQRFLGFANLYRRFIRNYNSIAAPLTGLTSSKVLFRWTTAADEAFRTLKTQFTSAPILQVPDPDQQFVVEVDASDMGVGAVLSQRLTSDQKLHPCAFFSHRLSAEQNYDIENRELLAVKLALEERRHWLEGTKIPFLVWSDHRNLEYVRTAKRLNSRQAQWSQT